MPLNNHRVTITKDFFDRCTYMIEGNQTKLVGIEDEKGKRIVDVMFDTPLFAIWSPEKKNAPFLCIEPWYGRCDAQVLMAIYPCANLQMFYDQGNGLKVVMRCGFMNIIGKMGVSFFEK